MATDDKVDAFSLVDHLRRVLLSAMPLSALELLALIFEFDNGPLENWWSSRAGGYGAITWEEAVRDHGRRLVRQDRPLAAKLWFKFLLIVLGPALKIASLLSIAIFFDWSQSHPTQRLLSRWAWAGAFNGVPELFDFEERYGGPRP